MALRETRTADGETTISATGRDCRALRGLLSEASAEALGRRQAELSGSKDRQLENGTWVNEDKIKPHHRVIGTKLGVSMPAGFLGMLGGRCVYATPDGLDLPEEVLLPSGEAGYVGALP